MEPRSLINVVFLRFIANTPCLVSKAISCEIKFSPTFPHLATKTFFEQENTLNKKIMKYEDSKLNSTELSGSLYTGKSPMFITWKPSTWPKPDEDFSLFLPNIENIFRETILDEIRNVISDAMKANGSLSQRGHVVALVLFCAVDTLSSYAYVSKENNICVQCNKGGKIGPRYKKYIEDFFPDDYKPHSDKLYGFYRNASVHSWNFFKVGIYPDHEPIKADDTTMSFGLLNFYDALEVSFKNFIKKLKQDVELQSNCRSRYEELRESAIP